MGDFKSLTFGSEAREQLLRGVTVLSDAVRVTLGPKGMNVVIISRTAEKLEKVADEIRLPITFSPSSC